MEMDPDYFKIAEARINSYEDYKKFIKKWLTREKDTHIRNLIWLML
jgi:hypothetical protein